MPFYRRDLSIQNFGVCEALGPSPECTEEGLADCSPVAWDRIHSAFPRDSGVYVCDPSDPRDFPFDRDILQPTGNGQPSVPWPGLGISPA